MLFNIFRKMLYVWNMETEKLIKVLDAHFGRIISLLPLTTGNWNSVITSSIDRSVKVWNINNIFEQVHVIDRHELQIDSIRCLFKYFVYKRLINFLLNLQFISTLWFGSYCNKRLCWNMGY